MNNCPVCGGEPTLLGGLGNVTWLRCRNCGWDYQAANTDFDDEVFFTRGDVEGEDEFD